MESEHTMKHDANVSYDRKSNQILCEGDWTISQISHLQSLAKTKAWAQYPNLVINGAKIRHLDSAGAWLISNLTQTLTKRGVKVELSEFNPEATKLLEMVAGNIKQEKHIEPTNKISNIAWLGKQTVDKLKELNSYLAFVGQLSVEFLQLTKEPKSWRWKSLSSIIYSAGYQGLPIIALLSFLVGVVLAYQMGLQLEKYGANVYIVDLLGLSILREFAPLMTAIMVSGRTGSAFTASLGMMKLNQEIDALNTLGVTPGELLLIPRIIGLMIVLPLLTMWADIFAILGGMVMSNNMLDISWVDFLQRFPQVIPLKTFIIGMGRTPVYALIIATIGCYEGMQVKNSADSVGRNTTKSVVLAIFFIIVADALFSIIFSKMKL